MNVDVYITVGAVCAALILATTLELNVVVEFDLKACGCKFEDSDLLTLLYVATFAVWCPKCGSV